MTLGQRIAHLRGRRSQKDVAAAAGIDAATLNRIERGSSKNPTEATLEAIAGALGVDVNDLADPNARVVLGFERESPRLSSSSDRPLPDDLGRMVNAMRAEIRDVLNIAWDSRGVAEAALGKAEEALRQLARRGRRSA